MAAFAGILNHPSTAGQVSAGAVTRPMASAATTSSSASGSSSSSATISANDFLTLLVTEMQNQDPTADTDPNEYINQLVSVNSLEQLIDINQNLSTALGDTTPSSGSTAPSTQAAASTSSLTGRSAGTQVHAAVQMGGAPAAVQSASFGAATAGNAATQTAGLKQAPGNLSVPDATPASSRVAHALDGRSHTQSIAGGFPSAR